MAVEEGMWCDEHLRYHQPRERTVPCRGCQRPTSAPHGVCGPCESSEVATVAPTVDVTIPAGVALSFHFYNVGAALRMALHLGDSDNAERYSTIVFEPRSLVAAHAMLGEAIDEWREKVGGPRWAEEFPQQLPLEGDLPPDPRPAAYLFSGPEGSWATRVREVAGEGVPVLDCHVNNGVDAVRSMLSSTGPVVLDGVHMLSAAAANALFTALNGRSSTPIILTTTDPAKVLPSIRAHCQHENTGRMAA